MLRLCQKGQAWEQYLRTCAESYTGMAATRARRVSSDISLQEDWLRRQSVLASQPKKMFNLGLCFGLPNPRPQGKISSRVLFLQFMLQNEKDRFGREWSIWPPYSLLALPFEKKKLHIENVAMETGGGSTITLVYTKNIRKQNGYSIYSLEKKRERKKKHG